MNQKLRDFVQALNNWIDQSDRMDYDTWWEYGIQYYDYFRLIDGERSEEWGFLVEIGDDELDESSVTIDELDDIAGMLGYRVWCSPLLNLSGKVSGMDISISNQHGENKVILQVPVTNLSEKKRGYLMALTHALKESV